MKLVWLLVLLPLGIVSLEPFTTVRIVTCSLQCAALPQTRQLVKIALRGCVRRVPNLTCIRVLHTIRRRGNFRYVHMLRVRMIRDTIQHILHTEEEERPLWLAILIDIMMDYIS
jgi:hypothetical protein